ncbi:HNH endonuclease [Bacillus subtilis]|uniref:HNH endonuclease n=1 Tax=Bacillus subtilis TaxID=1423 RepID=UPI003F7B86F4
MEEELEVRICKICGTEKNVKSFPIVRKLSNGNRVRRHVCRACSSYGTGNNIKTSVKKRVLEEANYLCFFCGEHGTSVDHIIPRSKGGTNHRRNLICACIKCNSRRGNMSVAEFQEYLRRKNSKIRKK